MYQSSFLDGGWGRCVCVRGEGGGGRREGGRKRMSSYYNGVWWLRPQSQSTSEKSDTYTKCHSMWMNFVLHSMRMNFVLVWREEEEEREELTSVTWWDRGRTRTPIHFFSELNVRSSVLTNWSRRPNRFSLCANASIAPSVGWPIIWPPLNWALLQTHPTCM